MKGSKASLYTKKKKIIAKTSEWNIDLLKKYLHEMEKLANDYQLETYPAQIELLQQNK